MKYIDKAKDIYAMSAKGKMLEAFEKYYHPDIVMVEATGEVRKGKDANREFEKNFSAGIREMHDFGVKSVTSNEDEGITMAEIYIEATFADGTRRRMEEVAVQKWEDGQIIHERFYYNT